MKTFLILMVLALSFSSFASPRGPLYSRSIGIADMMYLNESQLNEAQAQRIHELFSQIEEVVKNPDQQLCGDRNTVFRETFSWFKSIEGPNLTRFSSQERADQMSRKSCPAKYFEVYKNTFEWAVSINGPNKTKSAAMDFAEKIADFDAVKRYQTDYLSCIVSEFHFASSIDGLNLTKTAAEDFALGRCLVR